jgi:hypothetical protein
MPQVFGDYVERQETEEYLIIHFSPTSIPLRQRWRNSGLSADFLADYWSTFFPAHDVPSSKRRQEIKGAINYIANELLENTMQFSYKPAHHPVDLGLYLYQDAFRFYASNTIDPQAVGAFQARIQELLTEDPGELYMQQLEGSAATKDNVRSGLGLLTMLCDYDAHLAWSFETVSRDPDIIVVTTMVQLEV